MSRSSTEFSTHAEPVWRDRANFIANARLPEEGRFEQLWCRQVSEDTFEVCCIPFFLYDMALGDIVQTESSGSQRYVVATVQERSGRYVFRVFFERTQYRYRNGIVEELTTAGALHEWSSPSLLAVDARDQEHATVIAALLQERENQGLLLYETGKSA